MVECQTRIVYGGILLHLADKELQQLESTFPLGNMLWFLVGKRAPINREWKIVTNGSNFQNDLHFIFVQCRRPNWQVTVLRMYGEYSSIPVG